MSLPDRAVRAFEAHEAFERDGEAFRLTTVTFDVYVAVTETEGHALAYEVTVRAPMLSEAVEGEVGEALESGWFDTYALRLEDAPGAVRDAVELSSLEVFEDEGEAVALFTFECGNADRAPAIAKALAEYAEGTYMEGIVPGFDYREPIAGMLAAAEQNSGGRGGTPL